MYGIVVDDDRMFMYRWMILLAARDCVPCTAKLLDLSRAWVKYTKRRMKSETLPERLASNGMTRQRICTIMSFLRCHHGIYAYDCCWCNDDGEFHTQRFPIKC